MNYRLIEVDKRWYVAFKCHNYRDFVIEFSKSFASEEEANDAAKNHKVKPLNFSDEK